MDGKQKLKSAIVIQEAKAKARPELKGEEGWCRLRYHETFDQLKNNIPNEIERISFKKISQLEFINKYEKTRVPVILTDCTNHWQAMHKWTLPRLAKKYRNQKFRVGEDNDGYSVKMKMKYYVEYLRTQKDDSPLYIFDGTYGEHPKRRRLLEDYEVPTFFADDLFHYAGEKRRPPYRWVVIGPERSGTSIHIDPLGTCAWNSLLQGHKRWIMLPTETPKHMLQVPKGEGEHQSNEGIQFFTKVYPKIRSTSWPEQYKPIEFVQNPGDTVFVPYGWWHAVLNLDLTIAVTQNFASPVNFPTAWYKTVKGRPKLSKKWYANLKINRPEVAKIADSVDFNSKCLIETDSSSSCSSSSTSSSESESEDESEESAPDSSSLSDNGDGQEECCHDRRSKRRRLTGGIKSVSR